MSSSARRGAFRPALVPTEQDHPLEVGRRVIEQEAAALVNLAAQLDDSFLRAVELIEQCRGSVIVSGMGKAGLIGQKIAATLASTGTRSHFLHPAEAIHGDLGRIGADDVLLVLSHSGETEEVLRLLPSIDELRVRLLVITGRRYSPLARRASAVVWIGELQEAGRLQLAPSTSTTAMLAVGDALALAASQRRGFTSADFARFHPGGALGRRLSHVEEFMRPLHDCRVAPEDLTVRHVLVSRGRPGRRCGAVLLIDARGVLTGIFTDSDLARLLERQQDCLLDQPIRLVMTNSPTTVRQGTMMAEAMEILTARKISELPVTDDQHRPIGLIDITDIVTHYPCEPNFRDDARTASSAVKSPVQLEATQESLPMILPLSNPGGPRRVDET
jgi:arabinose-5-phosphate isomerase